MFEPKGSNITKMKTISEMETHSYTYETDAKMFTVVFLRAEKSRWFKFSFWCFVYFLQNKGVSSAGR